MGEDEFDPEFALISEATGNFYPVHRVNLSSPTGNFFSSPMEVYPPRTEYFPPNIFPPSWNNSALTRTIDPFSFPLT